MADGIVVFDNRAWAARYPELAASVPDAQPFFDEACVYLDNTPCSPVRNWKPGGRRAVLLNMLTAHIVALNVGLNCQPASPLVGRVTSASEGSVSVSTAITVPGSAEWFAQTKYGFAYWQATAQNRMMHYRPGRQPNLDPYSPFANYGNGDDSWRGR